MVELFKEISADGIYTCPQLKISVDDWSEILGSEQAAKYMDVLYCFMRAPQHSATCSQLSDKSSTNPQHYNIQVTHFSKFVQKRLGRFTIQDKNGDETFWLIPMSKGWKSKNGFVWQMRDELVDALRIKLMKDLIEEYKRLHQREAFNGEDEYYKWELLDNTVGQDALGIVRCLRGVNVVDNARVDGVFKELLSTKPQELTDCINVLFDEQVYIDDRLSSYKAGMRTICPPTWNICANDERTAASLLTCRYPDRYTFYKDGVYQIICQYFGFETKQAGKKYSHFTELINEFTREYGDEIQDIMSKETSTYSIRPANLAVQTLFWCMKDYMNTLTQKNMRFTWIPYYKEFADKLLQFRSDRKPLLDMIYSHRDEFLAGYLHDEGGESDLMKDIDPFTVFGMFNRGIKENNRKHTTEVFKDWLGISADVPQDFVGIPVLNNQSSHFFGFRKHRSKGDIENLWALFEKILKGGDIETEYNKVITQYIININITMGLFWIRPDEFIAFDKNNREYLGQYGIKIPNHVPVYSEYKAILDDIRGKMKSGKIKENSFYELSANAWSFDGEEETSNLYDIWVETWKRRKNIVLYGAPGTGKTFDIPELAVRLCDPGFDAAHADRDDLMERYTQLKQEKRIFFTTFHQSMDYEDWIEGLRPVVNQENNQVIYDVEPGIFKRLCEEAERPVVSNKQVGILPDAVIWKVSLAGTGNNPVRTDCMNNNRIRIGWDKYGSEINDETDWSLMGGEGKGILDAFINKMKIGDIVMSCYSSRTIDAIGVVTGEYEWNDSLSGYKRCRSVKWLVKGINEDIVEMNDGKSMTLGTVYRLNAISLDDVKALLDKNKQTDTLEDNTKTYVMAIDEMNRGNVSKVFGELITLLEPDKRKGRQNAESVILPYSKKPFSVPDNVYIIATMNTADRSLGTLDYAIRRRFAFIADRPYGLDDVPGFNMEMFAKVSQLFISNYEEYSQEWDWNMKLEPANTLSEEYRPEDVWIGQSYFIMQDENGEDNTSDRLLYEIIPLLEEYVRDGVLTEDANETIEELRKTAIGE